MGESVNGIRGAFYSDIIYDYQCKYDDKREKSFLYRAFWAEVYRQSSGRGMPGSPPFHTPGPTAPSRRLRIRPWSRNQGTDRGRCHPHKRHNPHKHRNKRNELYEGYDEHFGFHLYKTLVDPQRITDDSALSPWLLLSVLSVSASSRQAFSCAVSSARTGIPRESPTTAP